MKLTEVVVIDTQLAHDYLTARDGYNILVSIENGLVQNSDVWYDVAYVLINDNGSPKLL